MDRFGYVKRAQHGTRMLSWAELRATYGRELVKLANEGRYTFLNTLFSVSEAVMYMQARAPPPSYTCLACCCGLFLCEPRGAAQSGPERPACPALCPSPAIALGWASCWTSRAWRLLPGG